MRSPPPDACVACQTDIDVTGRIILMDLTGCTVLMDVTGRIVLMDVTRPFELTFARSLRPLLVRSYETEKKTGVKGT